MCVFILVELRNSYNLTERPKLKTEKGGKGRRGSVTGCVVFCFDLVVQLTVWVNYIISFYFVCK